MFCTKKYINICAELNKTILEPMTMIVLENGQICIVKNKGLIVNNNFNLYMDDYNEDLTCIENNEYNIVAIWQPINNICKFSKYIKGNLYFRRKDGWEYYNLNKISVFKAILLLLQGGENIE